MSLSAAAEPLRAANHVAGRTLYEITFIPADDTMVQSSAGLFARGKPLFENGFDFDLVLVAAAGKPTKYENPSLARYLKILSSRHVKLGGISGGPVLLAKYGLLDDTKFTVHWDHYAALRELSPEFNVERRIFCIDRGRYTCAGGTAPLDMMSAIISADHGAPLAKSVNDWLIYTNVRDAADPQRLGLVEKYQVHHPAVLSALELMQDHVADTLSVGQIAKLSKIGERQLSRLFQKYLNKKPMQFYTELRLEHARVLTEQSALPIVEIAIASGFESTAYFRSKFKEHFGKSPTQIRRALISADQP